MRRDDDLDLLVVAVKNGEEDKQTPADIIRANIDRANELFDTIQDNIANGGKLGAMMVQALAKLIDSITAGANALISAETDAWGLQIREGMLKLKERELSLKQMLNPPGGGQLQKATFVGSFSQLVGEIERPELSDDHDEQ